MNREFTFDKHHLELLLARFKGHNGLRYSNWSSSKASQNITMDKETFCSTFLEILQLNNSIHIKNLNQDCLELFKKVSCKDLFCFLLN